MPDTKLYKPSFGIDLLSDEVNLIKSDKEKKTAVRIAENIDLDRDGNFNRRKGFTRAITGLGYHSLYESHRGWLMLCRYNYMGIYNPANDTHYILANMGDNAPVSYTELNGNLYMMSPNFFGVILANETIVRPAGVRLPNITPAFAVVENAGSLAAGTYGLAYTVVNDLGEESPLSPIEQVTLETQSAIQGTLFTITSGYKYRIYLTTTDGEELYQAAEFDASVSSYLLTDNYVGRQPRTQSLDMLPRGYLLSAYDSRLYVASKNFVFFSEPFFPGLSRTEHNFLPCTGYVTMIQPVDSGIFVADYAGIRFYSGGDPTEFEVQDISSEQVVMGSALSIPAQHLPKGVDSKDSAALWLTSSGYYLGLSSGEAIPWHSEQLSLPNYIQGSSVFRIQDGRKQVITTVNSNSPLSPKIAVDSSTI